MTQQTDRLNAALAGRYEIERELGAGGMATVFLAEDLKHKRKVALKVLKPELAAVLGADRFVVEITTTASLQHPHILALFDSGTADGFLFYVMPWIQGETLRDKLNRETQLGVDEAVRIAREVLDALQYAHEHGIVHRDVKPENILLHGGHAMVADFGIALAVSAAAGGRMTETGLSLGTPHYMSPEQATAEKDISARSDVYSLGSVLYEMLTGNPPFTGAAAQQIIMKIITTPAEAVTVHRKSVPANVAAAVAKALEKLPADRFESAKAFADALGNPAYSNATVAGAASALGGSAVKFKRIAIAASVVAVAGIAGTVWFATRRPSDSAATFSTLAPAATDEWLLSGPSFALSPEGRRAAIVTRKSGPDSAGLLIRSLDSLGSQRLAHSAGAMMPFWSPDGRAIGFFADGKLKVLDLASGSVRSLCPAASPAGGTWGRHDLIVYTPETRGGPYRTSAKGGGCAPVKFRNTEGRDQRPQFLGDGVHLVVSGVSAGAWLATVDDDSATLLLPVSGLAAQAIVAPPDYLLYKTPDALATTFAQRIDVPKRRLMGEAIPILEDVVNDNGQNQLSAAGNGSIVAHLRPPGANRRAGRVQGGALRDTTSGPAELFYFARASSDGRQFVSGGFRLSVWDVRRNLWTDVVERVSPRRTAVYPVWSPRDTAIAFSAAGALTVLRVADKSLHTLPPDSAGRVLERVLDWSPDGRAIALRYPAAYGARYAEAWIADVQTGTRRRMFEESGSVLELRFAPDGRRVAYERVNASDTAIFVRPYPGPGPAVRVLPGSASEPRWSADGRSLYFRRGDDIEVVLLTATGEAARPPAVAVPRAQIAQLNPNFGSYDWDVATGTNDVFVFESGSLETPLLTLVQNWPALLKRAP